MNKKRLGFSLIELSIVILIIGILIIGISKGSRIIRASHLASARSLTASSPVQSTSGLILWLETSMSSSFKENISNGSLVTDWYDNTPTTTKNNAAQSTVAYQPTYQENVLNGLPVVRFDNSNDGIVVPNFDLRSVGTGGYAIFIVAAKTQNARGDLFGMHTASQFDNVAFFIDTPVSSRMTYYLLVDNAGPPSEIGSTNIGKEFNIYTLARYHTNASGYVGYINGAVDVTSTSTQNLGNIDSALPMAIGANYDITTSTPYFSLGGDIAEVIFFNRALKIQERKDIEQYLGKKYNIKLK